MDTSTPTRIDKCASNSPLLSSSGSKSQGKGISKILLTPCRRIGLKRKLGNSPQCPKLPKETLDSPVLKLQNPNDENSKLKHKVNVEKYDEAIDISDKKHGNCLKDKLSNYVVLKEEANNERRLNVNFTSIANKQAKDNVEKSTILVPEIVTDEMINSLTQVVKDKYENVKRTELSELYAKKHNLELLKELTLRWKVGCQEVLKELQTVLSERGTSMSMTELLSQFKIPHDFVSYNEDTEDFE